MAKNKNPVKASEGKNVKSGKIELNTGTKPTWCPGCFNFQIYSGVKKALEGKIKNKKDWDKYALVTGIGCTAKMFDYLNLNGINSIHGRVPPTCLGLKTANPDLNVLGFAGDGDAYQEGISHTIHAARYNANYTLFVHNNQVFALTVGQPTTTTEKGFTDKTNPQGWPYNPINPIKLMLSSGASFVARVFADVKQVEKITKEALKHKGFAFIEVLQPCIVFHPHKGYKEKIYDLQEKGHDKSDWNKAMKKAKEFNYNGIDEKTKIPTGIFYQEKRETFTDKFKVLKDLKKKGKSFKDIDR